MLGPWETKLVLAEATGITQTGDRGGTTGQLSSTIIG
jgi:hypothetical protein